MINDESGPQYYPHSQTGHPTITLKKGKIEIQINNAPAIIKRINEMYPEDKYNWNKRCRELSLREKDQQIKWAESAKKWFKTEIFGHEDSDFQVVVNEGGKEDQGISYNMDSKLFTGSGIEAGGMSKECVEDLYKVCSPKEPVTSTEYPSTVNKNAYEIRADVLKMALDWVKYKKSSENVTVFVSKDEDVLTTAKKFYEFVENRKRT